MYPDWIFSEFYATKQKKFGFLIGFCRNYFIRRIEYCSDRNSVKSVCVDNVARLNFITFRMGSWFHLLFCWFAEAVYFVRRTQHAEWAWVYVSASGSLMLCRTSVWMYDCVVNAVKFQSFTSIRANRWICATGGQRGDKSRRSQAYDSRSGSLTPPSNNNLCISRLSVFRTRNFFLLCSFIIFTKTNNNNFSHTATRQ